MSLRDALTSITLEPLPIAPLKFHLLASQFTFFKMLMAGENMKLGMEKGEGEK